jgi:hypothetical protein
MDYNPRMSMAPRGSQQSSQQKPKRDDDEDAFMKLVCKCDNETGPHSVAY